MPDPAGVARIRKLHYYAPTPYVTVSGMNYWATESRARRWCEGIRQCRNYGATRRKNERRAGSRGDHRAETRTARCAGWKLVIKIPAVALARENDGRKERARQTRRKKEKKREREREREGRERDYPVVPGECPAPGGLMCSNVDGV